MSELKKLSDLIVLEFYEKLYQDEVRLKRLDKALKKYDSTIK